MAATREDVPKQLYNDRNCEVTATQQSNLRPAQWKYLTEPRAESISNKQRKRCNHYQKQDNDYNHLQQEREP